MTDAHRGFDRILEGARGGNPMQTIQVKIQTHGRARKGENSVKVGQSLESDLLQERGWTLLRSGRGYDHLLPPPVCKDPNNPVISIRIPSEKQILALAKRLHKKGKPFMGDVFGWPVRYDPAGPSIFEEYEVDFLSLVSGKGLKAKKMPTPMREASFHIGGTFPWGASVEWDKTGKPMIRYSGETAEEDG